MLNIQDKCSLQTHEKRKKETTPNPLPYPNRQIEETPKLPMQLGGTTTPAPPNQIIAGSPNRQMLSIPNIQHEKSASNSRERRQTTVNPFPPLQIPVTYLRHNTNSPKKTAANPQPLFRSHANVSQADGCEGDSKGMATFSFFGHSHGSSTTPMAMAMTIGSHSHPCMPHHTHSFLQFILISVPGG